MLNMWCCMVMSSRALHSKVVNAVEICICWDALQDCYSQCDSTQEEMKH